MDRKRTLAGLLCAAMLFLLCAGCGTNTPPAAAGVSQSAAGEPQPEQQTPAQTDVPPVAQPDYQAAYAPVLDEIFSVLYNGYDGETDYRYVPTGVMEMSSWGLPRERIQEVGYHIEDISGDGISELLIGLVPDGAQVQEIIFGGYTCKDGEIVCFLDGWYRNSYRWMGGNRFFNTGSGGAMYSVFGICRLSEDGAELRDEDYYFTHETDESFEEIGYYHNDTGAWDVDASEKLNITDDEFWGIMRDYAAQCIPMDFMPFSEYPYTGFVSQPLDCKIRADYLDDVVLELSDYVDAAVLFREIYSDTAEYETTIVFRAEEDVTDFKLLALEFRDVDENGKATFGRTEVFSISQLQADAPLTVPMSFPGDIPSNGFSYMDSDGAEKAFTISISGKDGSLLVAPLD